MRLVPLPPSQVTLRATFTTVRAAVDAVTNLVRARVVPSALELIDGDSLDAVATNLGTRALAPEGTGALLLLEVDGLAETVAEEEPTRSRRVPRRRSDRGAGGTRPRDA